MEFIREANERLELARAEDIWDHKMMLCPLTIVSTKHFLRAYLLFEEACEEQIGWMEKV
jgi:hypothetical protein